MIGRRTVLAALGASVGAGLAGCAGFGFSSTRPVADDVLLVSLWAGTEEQKAFQALADGYTAATGVKVALQVAPFSQRLTTVDTGLRAGQPPDVFRATYNDVGLYRAAGVLAPLPDPERMRPMFAPAFWAAVSDGAGAFGVPHHTDTSMVLVNNDAAAAAGLGALPTTRDAAWSWDQFLDAARRLAGVRPDRYAFAVNWQEAGAYRWLNWVDQAGGRLLTPGLDAAAPADDPGLRAALQLTRRFFTDGLVPANSSTGGQDASELFTTQTVAMAFVGSFLLSTIAEVDFGWTAVPLPRAERASADLGGNALVATAGPRAEQALGFLEHCAAREQVVQFCQATSVLPTRVDVDAATLDYPVEPETMERYVEQSADIRPELVQQVTVPAFAPVNLELQDGLERAFLGRDPDAEVAADMMGAVDRAVRR